MRHLVIIEPSRVTPELGAINRLALTSPLPVTLHMPCLFGMTTLASEKTEDIAGIIILGSASSVNERLDWQLKLEEWLLPQLLHGIPTLGICYGHQMLAYMFGGVIGYVKPDQFKYVGFRHVEFAESSLWGKKQGPLIVSHNEEVKTLPSCLRVIGKSSIISVDAMMHETLPIFGVQSHPEAIPAFLKQEMHDHDQMATAQKFGSELVKSFLNFACHNGSRQD